MEINPRLNRGFVFVIGLVIGMLGGLIGLGGAEFRLPILMGLFCFASLEAVIVNKTMSLLVVTSALPFRFGTVPFGTIVEHGDVVLNLLAGSLLGAWCGASWATRLPASTLNRMISLLLVLMALLLLFGHQQLDAGKAALSGIALFVSGALSGFGIGVVASLMGVAGGELLIPTLVFLFGLDIKLAGSLSLAVSLPTMLTGFLRYRQDDSFAVLGKNRGFILAMALGSLLGTFIGGRLLGVITETLLLPLLAGILLISARKVWLHG